MECLPTVDGDRVKYWIQQDDISFDASVQKVADKADITIPRYSWEAQWKKCKPEGRTLHDIEIGFHKWTGLANEVGDLVPLAKCE